MFRKIGISVARQEGVVYQVLNKVTGKCYIGQTWDTIENRWRGHQRSDSPCILLKRAIEKYGASSFIVSQLTRHTSQEDLDLAEDYWIKYYDGLSPGGYNIKEGGAHGKHSLETKKKMSKAHETRAPHSDETKKKISASLMGRKFPERKRPNHPVSSETRKKISAAHIGKKLTESTREKIKRSWIERRKKKDPIFLRCIMCGKEFQQRLKRVVCCSRSCGNSLGHKRKRRNNE